MRLDLLLFGARRGLDGSRHGLPLLSLGFGGKFGCRVDLYVRIFGNSDTLGRLGFRLEDRFQLFRCGFGGHSGRV